MDNDKKKTESIEFLLHEFDNMEAERTRLKSEAVNRLNFFLTLTSAILGSLVLFGQYSPIQFEILIFPTLLFLSVIGWQTFNFIIGRDINIDRILRAIGRIRRYFSENDPTIKPYLSWRDDDEPSKLITANKSSVRRTTQSVLAFLISLAIGFYIFLNLSNIVTALTGGGISFIILIWALEFYASTRFKRAVKETQSKILHPKAKPS